MKFKKSIKSTVVIVALMVCPIGMTVFAATASITNGKTFTRYAAVSLRQYDNDMNLATIISLKEGKLAAGKSYSVSGTITKKHGYSYAYICNGEHPSSGTTSSCKTYLK